MFLTTEIGEDLVEKKIRLAQGTVASKLKKSIGGKQLEAEIHPDSLLKQSELPKEFEEDGRESVKENATKWESEHF